MVSYDIVSDNTLYVSKKNFPSSKTKIAYPSLASGKLIFHIFLNQKSSRGMSRLMMSYAILASGVNCLMGRASIISISDSNHFNLDSAVETVARGIKLMNMRWIFEKFTETVFTHTVKKIF